jgi:hypothetical protein
MVVNVGTNDDDLKRLREWFGEMLGAADFDLRLQDEDKGERWREATPKFLYDKMLEHTDKIGEQIHGLNDQSIDVHAVKVVNYALMIATRVTEIRREPEEKDVERDGK